MANKGEITPLKVREKISISLIGHIPWNKGLTKETDFRIAAYAESIRGRKPSKAAIENSVKTRKGKHLSEEHKLKTANAIHEANKDGHIGRKHSENMKAMWQNDEYAKPMRHKLASATGKHPNKGEIKFLAFIQDNFGPRWRYTGNGQLMVKGKSPDFWNGRKKVIEFYGKYWHQNDDPKDRIDFMEENGLKCEVIWDYEFKNNKMFVIEKLSNFIRS